MRKNERLMVAVREILLHEWDPIGVAHHSECCDEYDRYANTICRCLAEGIDEVRLTAFLSQLQTLDMGLPRVDIERTRAVARRLKSLSA